jgi:hypothetical protein
MSIYQQYHTAIVFGEQSLPLSLMPNHKSVFVHYLEDFLPNMITHSANLLLCSTDTQNLLH